MNQHVHGGLLNKIIHGNCAEVLKSLPDNFIDLVVTSPPYDGLRTYNGYSFPFEAIAKELYRVMKPGGVVVWVVADETKKGCESLSSFEQAIYFVKECGFRLHDTMFYEKNSSAYPAQPTGNRYTQTIEYMFEFSKGKPKTAHLICDKKNRWEGHKGFGTPSRRTKNGELVKYIKKNPTPEYSPRNHVWRYYTGKGFSSRDVIASSHPAIFPIELAIDHIRTWSEPGDVILEPFLGSGTTVCAAKAMGRHYIGIDISEEYCRLAEQRLLIPVDVDFHIERSKKIQSERYPQDSQKKDVKEKEGV